MLTMKETKPKNDVNKIKKLKNVKDIDLRQQIDLPNFNNILRKFNKNNPKGTRQKCEAVLHHLGLNITTRRINIIKYRMRLFLQTEVKQDTATVSTKSDKKKKKSEIHKSENYSAKKHQSTSITEYSSPLIRLDRNDFGGNNNIISSSPEKERNSQFAPEEEKEENPEKVHEILKSTFITCIQNYADEERSENVEKLKALERICATLGTDSEIIEQILANFTEFTKIFNHSKEIDQNNEYNLTEDMPNEKETQEEIIPSSVESAKSIKRSAEIGPSDVLDVTCTVALEKLPSRSAKRSAEIGSSDSQDIISINNNKLPSTDRLKINNESTKIVSEPPSPKRLKLVQVNQNKENIIENAEFLCSISDVVANFQEFEHQNKNTPFLPRVEDNISEKESSNIGSCNFYCSHLKDEFTIFGDNVACSLRNVKDRPVLCLAKHKINNVLYEAESGILNTTGPRITSIIIP